MLTRELFDLDDFGYRSARWMRCLFRGIDGEGDGPEAVVMGALGMVIEDLPGLSEFISFDV